jgi:hypothetical protein
MLGRIRRLIRGHTANALLLFIKTLDTSFEMLQLLTREDKIIVSGNLFESLGRDVLGFHGGRVLTPGWTTRS